MMKRIGIKHLSLVIGIAAIAGCVPHLTQQQCQNMDWYQVGFGDGSQGQNQRDLNSSIQDCSQFKLTVDTTGYYNGFKDGARAYCKNTNNAYQLGANGANYNHICPADLSGRFDRAWHHGLRQYCVPDTGYRLGRQGQPMPDFCAPDQINNFRNAYADGYHTYQVVQSINSQIDDINNHISDLNDNINDKENNINDLNTKLSVATNPAFVPDGTNPNDLRNQISSLNYQIMQLRDQIADLQGQKTSLQQQANDYDAQG